MKYVNYLVLLLCAVGVAYIASQGVWWGLVAPILIAAITIYEMNATKGGEK